MPKYPNKEFLDFPNCINEFNISGNPKTVIPYEVYTGNRENEIDIKKLRYLFRLKLFFIKKKIDINPIVLVKIELIIYDQKESKKSKNKLYKLNWL